MRYWPVAVLALWAGLVVFLIVTNIDTEPQQDTCTREVYLALGSC